MLKKQNIKNSIFLLITLAFMFFVYMYMRIVASSNGVWCPASVVDGTKNVTTLSNDIMLEYNFSSDAEGIRGVIFDTSYLKSIQAENITVSLMAGDVTLGSATVAGGFFINDEQTIFDFINIASTANRNDLKIRVQFQSVPDVQAGVDYLNNELPPSMVISSGKDAFCGAINAAYILLFVIVAIVLALVLFTQNLNLPTVYLVSVLGLGLIVSTLIPLMAAPDEATHLYIAYDISNNLLGIDPSANGTLMMRYDDAFRYYESENIGRAYLNTYFDSFFAGIDNSQLIDSGVYVADSPFYLHIFAALGITVGRLLGLGTTLTFMLGRWLNLLVFGLISYFAIRKVPFGKSVVFVWAMLPITLQQVASYSYDSMINALSILTICLTLHFMYGEKTENKKKLIIEIIILVLATLLLVPCKGHAILPLSLLPLMIIIKLVWDRRTTMRAYVNEKPHRRKVVIGVIVLAAVTILAMGALVLKMLLASADANGTYVAWTGSYAHTMGYYLKNPVEFVSIFINTLWAKGEEWFVQMIGGSLGWINIKVPIIFVLPFFLLLFYAGARREDESQPISIASKLWMWIVFLGICFLACLGMLLYWTPTTSPIIQGVQGRYFLPALVLPFIASRTKTTQVSKNADKIIVYTVMILYVFIVTSLIKRAL